MTRTSPLLGIYLNDHLAGASAGLELFRRAARSQPAPAREVLQQLVAEVEQDRESLRRIARSLGVVEQRYKAVGGWLAEKAGRLKPNGHLWRRSPLSDLVELEGLVLGVQGKGAGFRALRALAADDVRLDAGELDRLTARAQAQAETLEELRLSAARRVLLVTSPAGTADRRSAGPS